MTCAFRLDHGPGAYPPREVPGCQFPENNPIELSDGQTWCRFHLPMAVEDTETPKSGWPRKRVERFNEEIFEFIDAARAAKRIADLSGVVFPDEISFEQYRVGANRLPDVLFIGARFGGIASFQGVEFGVGTWFNETRFDHDARFQGASFGHASFRRVRFSSLASFEEARFGGASFEEARFGSEAKFHAARFDGGASFLGASFDRDAWFERARFGIYADFSDARFDRDVSFGGARFGIYAWFQETRFGHDADFSDVASDANRLFLPFEIDLEEAAATFSTALFVGAKFFGAVRFHNRKFLGPTYFRGVHFQRAPKFHGCSLHQDTLFPEEANFRDRDGTEAALAYRTLKHAMASVHARGEEAKFYVLEQKSLLRDKDTPLSTKFFSALYWLASDYGQSALRPLVGLLITFSAFFAIYFAFLLIYLEPTSRFVFPAIDFKDLLRFSLRQVFRPFEVFSLRVATPAEAVPEVLHVAPLPLALLAGLHSVLTLGFLALFLLALRRRFKLD